MHKKLTRSARLRNRLLLAYAAVNAALMPVVAHADPGATVDFTTAATSIKSDILANLPVGLTIFALVFGIVVIKSFFKKSTH